MKAGDPALTLFGRAITPNQHALAEKFVDLDSFTDTGEVSGTGWPWSVAARETDMAVCVGPPDVIVLGSFTVLP